jgi:hypothetical protein
MPSGHSPFRNYAVHSADIRKVVPCRKIALLEIAIAKSVLKSRRTGNARAFVKDQLTRYCNLRWSATIAINSELVSIQCGLRHASFSAVNACVPLSHQGFPRFFPPERPGHFQE